MANGAPLPSQSYNPFDHDAPPGTLVAVSKQLSECIAAHLTLELPPGDASQKILLVDYSTLTPGSKRMLDQEMERDGYWAFIVHTNRDAILCGLRADLAERSFRIEAAASEATFVVDEAAEMEELIRAAAESGAATFAIRDSFTTGYGYSTGQAGALSARPSPECLARAIQRGGPVNVHFRNRGDGKGSSLGSSRASLRLQLVDAAAKVSRYYREEWMVAGRPRVTAAFRTGCHWIRSPFTLAASLPLATHTDQVRLAKFETTLRGVEERLMVSIFGSLPNITWARILAKVFQNAEEFMGPFDVTRYRTWAAAQWAHAHRVGPGQLGCSWKGNGSRILPKGALGTSRSKPMHDDDNGVISLGCWTGLTEADTPTDLVFVVNGAEVILGASALRWVLFMGYIPHETRPTDPTQPGSTARLHHSAFVKPEAEHLAAQVLSNLPCTPGGGSWTMDAVRRLRADAFSDENMTAILSRG